RNYAGGYGPWFQGRGYESDRWYRRPKYNVPVNIEEKEDGFEITVYATGFSKENIRVAVADDILYINGTRNIDEKNPPHFIRQEFPVKTFERVISLYNQVDAANISARQENGILIISLPKLPGSQKGAQEVRVS